MSKNCNIKITEENIRSSNNDIFGDWFNNIEKLSLKTAPFDHIIIPDFINRDYYRELESKIPSTPGETWWKYENPLEVKYALDDLNTMHPAIRNVFYSLSHDNTIDRFKKIS